LALDALQRQMSGFVSVLGLDMQQGQAADYQVGAIDDAACGVIFGDTL
jgi:hypothetical protein